MNKKFLSVISMALIAALFAGVVFAGPAAAQGEKPGRPKGQPDSRQAGQRNAVVGQVTVINSEDFTLRTRQGDERSFRIDDRTRYMDRDRHEVDESEFKVGAWVAVVAPQPGAARSNNRPFMNWLRQLAQDPNEKPLARTIVILPEDFNPEAMAGLRGEVTAVSTTALTLKDKDGKETSLTVNGETRFNGQVRSLTELKQGMTALIVTEKQPDGSLLAINVRAGYRPERRMGEVTAVDTSAGTITIKTVRGAESITFKVDANTRFRSKGDTIKSLTDIKVGMMAIIFGRSENGTLIATVIAAGQKSDLPRFNK